MTIGAAAIAGVVVASILHGEFESMLEFAMVSFAAAVLLLGIGSFLELWRPAAKARAFVVRCGIASFLALPCGFLAARAVVRIDTWRAETYVQSQIAPQLERARSSTGRYPASLQLRGLAHAPRLIPRSEYASDGKSYTLSLMDPGVCGRVTSYSSATNSWTETENPCWY